MEGRRSPWILPRPKSAKLGCMRIWGKNNSGRGKSQWEICLNGVSVRNRGITGYSEQRKFNVYSVLMNLNFNLFSLRIPSKVSFREMPGAHIDWYTWDKGKRNCVGWCDWWKEVKVKRDEISFSSLILFLSCSLDVGSVHWDSTMEFHLYNLVELETTRDFSKWTSWMSLLYTYYLLGIGIKKYACGKTSWILHDCFLFLTLLPHLPSSHLPTFTYSSSISAKDTGVEKAFRFQVMNTSSSKYSAMSASNIILPV